MRLRDWSSDVCSSDLVVDLALEAERLQQEAQGLAVREEVLDGLDLADRLLEGADVALDVLARGEGRARGDLVLLIALEDGERRNRRSGKPAEEASHAHQQTQPQLRIQHGLAP